MTRRNVGDFRSRRGLGCGGLADTHGPSSASGWKGDGVTVIEAVLDRPADEISEADRDEGDINSGREGKALDIQSIWMPRAQ